MVGEIVVAADKGRHDFRFAAQSGLEGHAGTHNAFAHFRADVRLVLAADAGEKLIDIVYDTICHDPLLLCHFRAVSNEVSMFFWGYRPKPRRGE